MSNDISIHYSPSSLQASIGEFSVHSANDAGNLLVYSTEFNLQFFYDEGQPTVRHVDPYGSSINDALEEGGNFLTLGNLEISMFVENGRMVKSAFHVIGQTDEALLFTGIGLDNPEAQLVTDTTELTELFPGFETSNPSEPDEPSVDAPTQDGVEVHIGPYKMSQSNPGDFAIEGADFSYALETSYEGQLFLSETGPVQTFTKDLEEGYNYTTLEGGVQLILYVRDNTLTDAFTRLETQPDEVVLLRGLDTDNPMRTDISGQEEVDRVIPLFDTEACRFERVDDAETGVDAPTQDGVEVHIGPYKMSQCNPGDFAIEGTDFSYALETSYEGQLFLSETGPVQTFIKNLEEGYNYITLEGGVQLILNVSDNTLTDAFTRLETQPDEVVLLRGLDTDNPMRSDISGQQEVDRVIPLFDTEACRFERVEEAETDSDSPIGGLLQSDSQVSLIQSVDGDSNDWGWGLTDDGQGIVIWNDAGYHKIFDALVEQLEFNDRTVDLTPLFEAKEATSEPEAHVIYVDFSDEQESYEMDDEVHDDSFIPLEEMAV